MELGRIEQVHIFHEKVLRISDINQMWPHFLLNNSVRSNIGDIEIFIEVERIPDLPILAISILFGNTSH